MRCFGDFYGVIIANDADLLGIYGGLFRGMIGYGNAQTRNI